MTDRIYALTVTLERDIRTDDIESLITAIRQLRGVLSVKQHVADMTTQMAEDRARRDLTQKLWDVLK